MPGPRQNQSMSWRSKWCHVMQKMTICCLPRGLLGMPQDSRLERLSPALEILAAASLPTRSCVIGCSYHHPHPCAPDLLCKTSNTALKAAASRSIAHVRSVVVFTLRFCSSGCACRGSSHREAEKLGSQGRLEAEVVFVAERHGR